MKILICGDVVGRSGREVINHYVPKIIVEESIDFVVVNGENAANGFGLNLNICEAFYKQGVDVITSGNHIWDQKEVLNFIKKDKRLLRPINFSKNTPGKGFGIFLMQNGTYIVVINVLCRLFMDMVDDPFESLKNLINKIKDEYSKSIIIVDVHGEATSEKMAIGHFLDGQVSAVVGTHTHVPTADLHCMEKGTFFQADLGMCGDYDSVVGMNKNLAVQRFVNKHLKVRLETARGKATLCGVIIDVNENNCKVEKFEQIFRDGILGKNNGRTFKI